jgi:hypothetical protein
MWIRSTVGVITDGKTEVLGERPVRATFCLPQIPRKLPWDGNVIAQSKLFCCVSLFFTVVACAWVTCCFLSALVSWLNLIDFFFYFFTWHSKPHFCEPSCHLERKGGKFLFRCVYSGFVLCVLVRALILKSLYLLWVQDMCFIMILDNVESVTGPIFIFCASVLEILLDRKCFSYIVIPFMLVLL